MSRHIDNNYKKEIISKELRKFRENLDLEFCDSCIKHIRQTYTPEEEPEHLYCNDCAKIAMSNYIVPSLDITKYKHIDKDIAWLNNIDPKEFNETKTGTYVYGNCPASDCHVYESYIFLMHATDDTNTISEKRTCDCGITNDR